MRKTQIIIIIAAILFLNISGFSQTDEQWIRRPLRFTRTQRTLTVKGMVVAEKLVLCYTFKGRKTQRITTVISSAQNNSGLNLAEQEGDPYPYTDGYVPDYSGVLLTSTIYEICVRSEKGKSNYTLQVTLE